MFKMRRRIAMETSIYKFEREFCNNEIKEFEINILSDRICSAFIPTSFIKENNKLIAVYRYDGFLKISQCRFREIIQILNLIEKTIVELAKGKTYYIDYNKAELSCDTIFYCSSTEEIKIAYVPTKVNSTFGDNLRLFIHELKNYYFGNSSEYLDKLIEFLKVNNHGVEEILNKIIELKREINMYGVK